MSSNNKMKGLFRNIRLMFDSEKEPEIQIGYPTDVKHVAHIGWDGPSVNSPSWMNEFKSPNGFASAPIAPPGEVGQNNEPIQWSSEDKGRPNRNRDLPEVPKATRRNMSAGAGADSPSREKPRSRRSSKSSKDDPDRPRRHKEAPQDSQDSTSQDLPDIPKTRRKKSKDSSASKDSSIGRSSRSKTKSHDTASSECGSVKSLGSERRRNSARDSLEELEEAIS